MQKFIARYVGLYAPLRKAFSIELEVTRTNMLPHVINYVFTHEEERLSVPLTLEKVSEKGARNNVA